MDDIRKRSGQHTLARQKIIQKRIFTNKPITEQGGAFTFLVGPSPGFRVNADPDTDPDPAFFLIADPDSGSRIRIRIPDPDPGFDDLKLKKIYSWKFNCYFLDQKLPFTYP